MCLQEAPKRTLFSFLTPYIICLADPGEARGCSTNTSVIHSLIHSLIQSWFVKIFLRRRHALMADGAFSHNIDYVTIFKEILNPEVHLNRITGSKVMAILLNGGFCPLVELDREGSAPAVCAAGLFLSYLTL